MRKHKKIIIIAAIVIVMAMFGTSYSYASGSVNIKRVLVSGGAALVLDNGVGIEEIVGNGNEPAIVDFNSKLCAYERIYDDLNANDANVPEDSEGRGTAFFAACSGLEMGMAKSEEFNSDTTFSDEECIEIEDFSNLVIADVDWYVNVRDIPGEEGNVVGKLYDESVGEYIEEDNGWYKISSGNVTGYVKSDYCIVGDDAISMADEIGTKMAIVVTPALNVHEEPDMNSNVIDFIPMGEAVLVVENCGDWIKINVAGAEGYVLNDYVTIHTEFTVAESREEEEARLESERIARENAIAAATEAAANLSQSESTYDVPVVTGDSNLGNEVAQFALQFVGNPYVYGGTSLTNGADCSGFVMTVYGTFGVSLSHSTTDDRYVGYAVNSLEEAVPGDIICYSGHVGIYIGNGQIVHAATPAHGICVGSAEMAEILAIRRIF